ncbi:hypothetical protein [Paenibacillus macerans]|uniref:CdiA C-terminal domain-containing protein n=1 Tax=Paenibacillus macerans TaxID=44252 RepID=UPI00203CBDE5|nr:hypothetical protein [Paenibacillus macerans]MCM3703368.1 hypothetical protein [Paenibacillus macerans]
MQKVNPDQVEQLSRQLDRLRQTFEETNTGMYRELNRLLGSVESAYHENNVRSAARAARDRLQKIMSLSMQLDDHMRSKAKALTMAAGQYRQTEKEMLALTRGKNPPVFTLKGLLQSGLNRSADARAANSMGPHAAVAAPPSILQLIKESLLKIQEWSLESRLAPVKEDALIAALLASLDTGSAEEQLNAQRELEIIAKGFEEIARSQAAYRIYMAYGNRMYMEQAHQEAEKYRKVLAGLGVSQEWFKEGVNLAEFQKGSPLDACAYNPLKQDGSPMPKESELRLVIAAGMLNAVYREWARSHYDQIEAAVLKAAEQRRKLQEQLDAYNREVPEEDIRKLQQYLKDMNIYHGEITGKYNKEFLIAVAGYQHIANTVSSVAAVRRDMFGLEGYQFEVDGKITKELLDLAVAERGLGIRNNPDLDTRGMSTAFTTVGVGEGIVKQLGEDAKDFIEYAISVQPTSLQFWTETIPGYYDLGKAIAGGEITYDDIKNSVGEGLAQEFVVPFEQINELSDNIFSGKATYEESVTYGRALTKAVMALTLVNGAVKSGAKISAKTSKKLAELLPKIKPTQTPLASTPEGSIFPITGPGPNDIPPLSKNERQKNFIQFYEEKNRRLDGEIGKGIAKIKPSKQPDPHATPKGPKTKISPKDDEATQRSLARENQAAEILAKDGYDIEQNPKIEGITRKPDYRIEGELFDCYSPAEKTSARSIGSTIEEKVITKKQADRVILNLSDWKGNTDSIVEQLRNYPIEGLKEVIVITKEEQVISIYP